MRLFYFTTLFLLLTFIPAKANVDTLVCDDNLWVQKKFSTCGDAANDHFLPRFIDRQPVAYKLQIFDRWGRPVFTTTNVSEGWNGKKDGEVVEAGAYYWTMAYRYPDEEAERRCNGFVEFVR